MKKVLLSGMTAVIFVSLISFAFAELSFEEKQQISSLECGIYYDSKFVLKNYAKGCYFLFEDYGELSFFSTDETFGKGTVKCFLGFHVYPVAITSLCWPAPDRNWIETLRTFVVINKITKQEFLTALEWLEDKGIIRPYDQVPWKKLI